MYGNLIQDFFTQRRRNWAIGSALSVIMLVVTVAPGRRRAAGG